MLLRLGHGRRFQNCLKYTASALVAIVYFAFLFRQSINAYEEKKENNLVVHTKLSPRLKKLTRTYHTPHAPLRMPVVAGNHTKRQSSAATEPALPTTLNPIYEYSEELHSATEKELKSRNAHLQEVCQRYGLQVRYPPNTWEFFISPGHNLVWCNVFKAASSTWLYYFNILGGYNMWFLQRTKQPPLNLARRHFPRPEMHELIESLPNSISFLFVREPFERILSAYRDKLETSRHSYFQPLCHKIVKRYRKPSNKSHGTKASTPTFPEFINYLIDEYATNKTYDEHWAPVYSFCTPCSVNFTLVGKVETFQRDAEYIIRQAGLESLLLGRLPKHKERKIGNMSDMKTKLLIEKYYSQLDRKTFEDLLNIYRLDFELFDYDFNKYYKIVSGKTAKQDPSMENSTTTTINVKTHTSPISASSAIK